MNRPEIITAEDTAQPERKSLLGEFHGAKPPAPFWFDKAIADAPERSFVEVQGAKIEMLTWGERGKPGLMFLHGNGAHADWWSFIAPSFARDYRVAAFSLSGMGGSGWRTSYGTDVLVDEGFAVMEAAGLFDAPQKPILIGHSFGAFVTSGIAAKAGSRIKSIVVVDGPFLPSDDPTKQRGSSRRQPRTNRVYESFEAAMARFRFAPEQTCDNLYIADWIARHSLKTVAREDGGEGWTWKFDPKFWQDFRYASLKHDLRTRTCPVAIIGGARSGFITQGYGKDLLHYVGNDAPLISIPNAQHHIMADEPLALIASLRTLLASWPGAR